MKGTLQVPANGVDLLGKPTIDVGDYNKYALMTRYAEELFDGTGPRAQDVCQGYIGDCFLLASILSVILQRNGAEHLLGMMKDVGTPDAKKASRDNPAYVVVRFFDTAGQPRYVKLRKTVVIDSRTVHQKSPNQITQPFANGSLWVPILEQAFQAFDKNWQWSPSAPTYSRVDGGYSNWALAALLGADVHVELIPDLTDPTQRANFAGLGDPNKFFFDKLMQPTLSPNDRQTAVRELFFNNSLKAGKFFSWCSAKNTDPLYMNNATNVQAFVREITNKQSGSLRMEHLEAFFAKAGLDEAARKDVVAWLKKNQVVSGKRHTGLYSMYDDKLFSLISDAVTNGKPAVLGTRANIGVTDKLGHSGGESMVKGLVASHAYAVVDAEVVGDKKYVSVYNPWGSYGRKYDAVEGGKLKAKDDPSAVSRLPLQEVSKRFTLLYVSSKTLK